MSKKGIVISTLLILVYIAIVTSTDKDINWTPTFDETETKPLASKIFFEELENWFPKHSIKKIHSTFYEYHNHIVLDSNNYEGNYMSISGYYEIDQPSFNSLLNYIGEGNKAFISAEDFPMYVKDTLQFYTKIKPFEIENTEQKLHLNYSSEQLTYTSKLPSTGSYIQDTLAFRKLGYTNTAKNKNEINFIGIPYKKGIFYIHTNPEIFTNYQLLASKNNTYINTVISYLPEKTVYFNKAVKQDPKLSNSPLRYILSQPPLKWAWYIGLIGITSFILFNSKRRQRIIPIIIPTTNSTVAFIKTLSNLFYESQDYNSIIQKKIIYFLEHVRSHYHLSTDKLDSHFIYKLANKSNNSIDDVHFLINMISNMREIKFTSESPLITLNKKTEEFYKNQQPN